MFLLQRNMMDFNTESDVSSLLYFYLLIISFSFSGTFCCEDEGISSVYGIASVPPTILCVSNDRQQLKGSLRPASHDG